MPYIELQTTSNYSFLRGASQIEELFKQAALYGYTALAITDRNSLAGIPRAHLRASETGIRLIVGCRLDLQDGTALLVYPTDRPAYSRLCQLLSTGKKRAGKGACHLDWDDVAARAEGLLAILVPDEPGDTTATQLTRLRQIFPDRAYLALTLLRRPGDAVRIRRLVDQAGQARVPTVVTSDVLYHEPGRRILQDVVTCIREGCTIDEAGFRRERSVDRHLQRPEEMARLFEAYPEALANTEAIAARCQFALSELQYQYPDELERPGEDAQQTLERLTWEAAPLRYKHGVPDKITAVLRKELGLIREMEYAPYFLTVNTIVRQARSMGILCQGRGSAANSAVCYVLGITAIDPIDINLLFERFISRERREPPDIDVDFEHERREEVIQWIYEHYGRDRAALCATVICYRTKGAIRDVGKVMGLTEDVTAALSSQVWGWSAEGVQEEHAAALNLNIADRRLRLTLDLARTLIGFPRHLSQHPGGFVLTRDKLADLVPIEPASMKDRQVIEWDKDDIEHLKFMKVDILGLGMLGCMRRAFDLLDAKTGERHDMATIPKEDPQTYDMICKADTLGTFQIESRAQMSMLPRHKPRKFYDLVIQVAIVRPGPIQGDMVHPYLRRREGLEPVDFLSPDLEPILGRTFGIPLFQEHAMQVAIICAGFSPGQADQLRRSMGTFKRTGGVGPFHDQMVDGMVANGQTREFAEKIFKQIEGFGSYGFPESHAASFALIAYASAWMKCHHPDVFCAALLNAQPMGFYAPAQIVRDARDHHVPIHPVCLNASQWDCTLEDGGVRLGLCMVKGLAKADAEALVEHRGIGYTSIPDTWRRARITLAALERIAEADGFASLGLDRRSALWALRGLGEAPLPLFAAAETREPSVSLAPMTAGRVVVEDYRTTSLSLRRHPVSFLRDELAGRGILPCGALPGLRDGKRAQIAGLILVRQRPGSAKGVIFITLEDETGIANLIVWKDVFERQRRVVLSSSMLGCHGRVQQAEGVTHMVVERLEDLSGLLRTVGQRDEPFPLTHGRGDEATHGGGPDPRESAKFRVRDIYIPDSGIRVKTRDFR
jgi:error-prone DNA polymerase